MNNMAMYAQLGISEKVYRFGEEVLESLRERFDGIDRVVAPLSEVEYNAQDKYANMGGSERAVLYLTNGKTRIRVK